MTLIVVTQDAQVFVDSYSSWGGYDGLVDKRVTNSAGTFTAAGGPDILMDIATQLERISEQGRFDYCYPYDHEEHDHTIVWRDTSGKLFYLVSEKGRHWVPLPQIEPTPWCCGSGADMFLAYYKEHNDVQKALELVCNLCNTVASPINTF